MKKILLIYPCPDEIKSCRFGYSLLLLYIASDLRNRGFNVELLDYSVNKYSKFELSGKISADSIVILEIDAFPLKRSVNFKNAQKYVQDIRSVNKKIPIIAIGKQCTLFHKMLDFVDCTISGDSEISISSVIENIEKGMPLSKYIDCGVLEDMSKLPYPAYDLLSNEQICGKTSDSHLHLAPSALLETSRGCPGTCTFCQRKGWGKKISYLPLNHIYHNFELLLRSGIRNIWIVDENFGGNLARAREVMETFINIKKNYEIRMSLSSWTKINTEFLDLAKKCGVSIISFGIESVVKENQLFYKKPIDIDNLRHILEYADSIGIFTVGNFIIGSPFDSPDVVEQSLLFAKESALDVVNVKTLDYMIGSELYEQIQIPSSLHNHIHFFSSKEFGTTSLTQQEIQCLISKFYTEFNSPQKVIHLRNKILKFGPPYFSENQIYN
ncbi:MAG: radical SAM protein [Thermoguttaceae bacterium]|nr:radical SAM protein [Thermoguttaceae bacterium]